jgi:hypothetical protein
MSVVATQQIVISDFQDRGPAWRGHVASCLCTELHFLASSARPLTNAATCHLDTTRRFVARRQLAPGVLGRCNRRPTSEGKPLLGQ